MSQSPDLLEPRSLWGHFAAICRIPHPSKQEQAIRQYVLDWAAAQGFASRVDAAGSVAVSVPATKGHEDAPTIVLQGHLDMVCEKNSDVEKDFVTEPIDAYVDDDWVRARGTTLGADNGIGLAAGMAAADDPAVVHGPLELLFTVDEETGLTGASCLEGGFVTGDLLLNLDSEEDGALYVGCAGGGDSDLRIPLSWAAPPAGVPRRIKVAGLRGGHSGLDIIENRGNALKLLARALREALGATGLALGDMTGGDKHNAIPREAWAEVLVGADEEDALRAAVGAVERSAREEFGASDPDLRLTVETAEAPARVFDPATRDRVVDLVLALPHGALAMSRDILGLVETSNNVARIRVDGDAFEILTSSRSSVAAALAATRDQVRACAALAGGETRMGGGYPGWKPNMASPLLATAKEVFSQRFGREPKVAAIHAGLECGIIGERYPKMDMLSFGPEIRGAHSPEERVSISSTGRFWTFLRALLAELA